jgi:uncharacterized membrane protein YidH (DUF202 family)
VPLILKEILFAAGAMAFSALFIVQSFKFSDSAALMPRILASLIIVLSVAMTYQGYRARQRAARAGEKEEIPHINVPLVATFLAFIVAYVLLIGILGYFVATPLFLIGTYLYLRAMSLRSAIIVACGFCALVYGVFVKVLHLPVPLGLLETILG